MRRTALFVLALLYGASPIARAEQMRAWQVKELASANADWIGLGVSRQAIIKKLSTSQVRKIYAAFSALEATADTHAKLLLVDGKLPNAFATLDRHGQAIVALNFAMLELLAEDLHQVAAVLGHELAHLKLGHVKKSAERERTGALLGAIGEAVLGSVGVPGSGFISNMTMNAVTASFNREQERAADYLGTVWAAQAGFDPMGGAHLHQRLMQISAGSGSFLSSHPSSPERIATLQALGARLRRHGE